MSKNLTKYLQESKTVRVSRNNPDGIRKGFEMEGIDVEPEDPFEDLVADPLHTLSSKALSFFYGANYG